MEQVQMNLQTSLKTMIDMQLECMAWQAVLAKELIRQNAKDTGKSILEISDKFESDKEQFKTEMFKQIVGANTADSNEEDEDLD